MKGMKKARNNYQNNKAQCGAKYKLFKDTYLIKDIENYVIVKKRKHKPQ